MGGVSAEEHVVSEVVGASVKDTELLLGITVLVFAEGFELQPALPLFRDEIPVYLSSRDYFQEMVSAVMSA